VAKAPGTKAVKANIRQLKRINMVRLLSVVAPLAMKEAYALLGHLAVTAGTPNRRPDPRKSSASDTIVDVGISAILSSMHAMLAYRVQRESHISTKAPNRKLRLISHHVAGCY
jgi:hypothetical protein